MAALVERDGGQPGGIFPAESLDHLVGGHARVAVPRLIDPDLRACAVLGTRLRLFPDELWLLGDMGWLRAKGLDAGRRRLAAS